MAPVRETLTPREAQIVDLLCAGESPKEIAAGISMTRNGVTLAVQKARQKMGCRTTPQLISKYVRQRLFQ